MSDREAAKRETLFARLAAAPAEAAAPSQRHVSALFDPSMPPISDEQRALAFAALSSLLNAVGKDILMALGDKAALPRTLPEAVRAVERSSLVRAPELASALLHRAEEHRVAKRLKEQVEPGLATAVALQNGEGRYVEALFQHDDERLSRRADAYLALSSARIDDDGLPAFLPDELAEPWLDLVHWWMAAALAGGEAAGPIPEAAPALSLAAREVLAVRDEALSGTLAAVRLAARLEELGEIDANALLTLASEGDALLLSALLAVRANMSLASIWALMTRSEPQAFVALIVALGVDERAGTLLVHALLSAIRSDFAGNEGLARVGRMFSNTDVESASDLLRYWRLDPAFRAAHAVIG